jgi:O-acetyl-ADP-ribose deacetylase (regulator of RNase III)
MIHYVKGDLIDAFKRNEVTMIAHGCNCQRNMGGGIARALANEYPQIERADDLCEMSAKKRLGRVMNVEIEPNKYILNCYTQLNTNSKCNISYRAIKRCMKAINQYMIDNLNIQNAIFGIPKIGAGLGGGNWDKIERIINRHIKGDVYVYEL